MALPNLNNKDDKGAERLDLEKAPIRVPKSIKFKLDAKNLPVPVITVAQFENLLAQFEAAETNIRGKLDIVCKSADAAAVEAGNNIKTEIDNLMPQIAGFTSNGLAQYLEAFAVLKETMIDVDPDMPLFIIGDPLELVRGAWPTPVNEASPLKITNGTFLEYLKAGGIRFSGMRMTSANKDASVFAQDIFHGTADLDGFQRFEPISLEKAIDGDNYDNSIQEFKLDVTLAKRQALIIPVPKDDIVHVTLYTHTDYNRR